MLCQSDCISGVSWGLAGTGLILSGLVLSSVRLSEHAGCWLMPFPLIFALVCLQESLARLQRAFARKWEFIFMQAEAQAK